LWRPGQVYSFGLLLTGVCQCGSVLFFVVFVIGFVAVVSFLYALGCNPYLYSSLMIGRTPAFF
jgi:hypothetical protein